MDAACEHIDERLTPYYPKMIREVTKDDILRLMEIKMQRILKFNKDKADELMAKIKAEIEEIDRDLNNMVEVTAKWFTYLKEKYGKNHPRLTEIRNFDTIEATKVVEANEKLYINRQEGFIGTGLKKDEFVCNCSDIDDIIIFYKDGKYKVVKVADKLFVGKNIMHVDVFKKNDKRTIYNAVYRDGKQGYYYIKRFNVPSITRDREYDLTQGKPGSRVNYFTANPNGEAEIIKVTLDPTPKLKNIFIEKDFSTILVKGRTAMGNILTKYPIHRISLKSHGHSTLGGRKVWFDPDVNRLNYDDHGRLLGEFNEDDSILVVLKSGEYYMTNFDVNNHYEDNILRIEKFEPHKIWCAVVRDEDQKGIPYIKRFIFEMTKRKQSYIGENPKNVLLLLTDTKSPRLLLTFGGLDSFRGTQEIDVNEFALVKGYKARGKRLTTFQLDKLEELEPLAEETAEAPEDIEGNNVPAENDEAAAANGASATASPQDAAENLDPDAGKSQQQIIDEITGQLNLFGDDDK